MSAKREELTVPGYEKVVAYDDPGTGLKAIVAIHNTALGPACGGIRMLAYPTREDALKDVLRLARGMSYKSSLAGIGFGGGKSVIIGDPARKTPELFRQFGEFVNTFDGRYIAAQDMNITSRDLAEVRKTSPHVLGIEGMPGSSGDPSPVTARGVFRALEATAEKLTGKRSLQGVRVALQGVGSVGFRLAELARGAGAELWVADVDAAAVRRAQEKLDAHPVALEALYDLECEIFSPNARGAILSESTIPRLRCRAVVGAANNQLATEADGMRLHERGILYAPDYAVNAGGIINIFVESEGEGYDQARAFQKADGVYDTLKEIFRRAEAERVAPFIIADKLAEERMRAGR